MAAEGSSAGVCDNVGQARTEVEVIDLTGEFEVGVHPPGSASCGARGSAKGSARGREGAASSLKDQTEVRLTVPQSHMSEYCGWRKDEPDPGLGPGPGPRCRFLVVHKAKVRRIQRHCHAL